MKVRLIIYNTYLNQPLVCEITTTKIGEMVIT